MAKRRGTPNILDELATKPKKMQVMDDILGGSKEATQEQAASAPRTRKKRKDATGQKKDYHKGTSVIAVRLPDTEFKQVEKLAKKDGLSKNAWILQLIREWLNNSGKP